MTTRHEKEAIIRRLSVDHDFVATSARASMDDYFVHITFSCGPTDGLVLLTMTKADFKRDFVNPIARLLET